MSQKSAKGVVLWNRGGRPKRYPVRGIKGTLKWQRNGEVTDWNPVFAYAMLEMSIGVELCWPYSPEQKGAVENLVGS